MAKARDNHTQQHYNHGGHANAKSSDDNIHRQAGCRQGTHQHPFLGTRFSYVMEITEAIPNLHIGLHAPNQEIAAGQEARNSRPRKEIESREHGRSNDRENIQREWAPKRDQLPAPTQQALIREIDTIIGGPHPGGSSNNSQKRYIREAKELANVKYHLHTCPTRTDRSDPIIFTLSDAVRVHFSHNDALVVRAVVA
ncbi:hypothetical protein Fot_05305 [Forsythia ovata]|uniref:Uncharacterized protein n=1 Tax=Forsythia ovata TaxID=205694 RepID=A0ABD1WPS1_9LAMI